MNPPPVSGFPVVTGYMLIASKADLSPSTHTQVYIYIDLAFSIVFGERVYLQNYENVFWLVL